MQKEAITGNIDINLSAHAEADRGYSDFMNWRSSNDKRIEEMSFFIERMNIGERLDRIEPLNV